MGFDKPQKIKVERAGRHSRRAGVDGVHERGLSAQAQRRATGRCPPDIVTRQVDVTTNMLATPYCPRDVVVERVLHSAAPIPCCRATSTSRRCCIRTRSGVTGSYPGRPSVDPARIRPNRHLAPSSRQCDLSASTARHVAVELERPRDSLRVPDSVRVRPSAFHPIPVACPKKSLIRASPYLK